MKRLLVLAGLICLSGPAYAADLPQYDVKAYCKQVSEVGGGGSKSVELGCRQMEAEAQKALSKMDVPAQMMNYCREVAEIDGFGSYSTLQGCIEMEQEAASQLD